MLTLCLLATLPAQALAASPAAARKAPARKAPAQKGDFQTVFADALRLYEALDYEQALELLSQAKALAQGGEQEVAVALYQGIILAELGQREQSLAAFRTGLYLRPDATLPVTVSPKVERDFEDVRQAVLVDLGAPVPAPAPGADRPLQPAPGKEPLSAGRVQMRPPPPAYVPSVGEERTSQRAVLPLALLGAGAVAGGAAGFFGLQSMSNVRSAQEATYYDERAEHLKSAENQALIANILFGTAGAAALGALATFFLAGGSTAPAASASTGGTP